MATNPLLPARRPANPYPVPEFAGLGPFSARLAQIPRERLEALSEAVIASLDMMDGDPDLEPDDLDTGIDDDPRGFDPEEDMCRPAFVNRLVCSAPRGLA